MGWMDPTAPIYACKAAHLAECPGRAEALTRPISIKPLLFYRILLSWR